MTANLLSNLTPHPMAVDERWFRALISARLSLMAGESGTALAWDDDPEEDDDPTADVRVVDGVAIVPIHGLITKRGRFWWFRCFSSDRCSLCLRSLVGDRPDVKSIVLDVDSGGGEVFGTDSLAETIFSLRGTKPIHSCVNELATSAGYYIAAAADDVRITKSGMCGSIGVYKLHVDYTQMETDAGIRTTVIHAGKYKAIHERPLTADLAAHEQNVVDSMYQTFVEAVGKYRGVAPQVVLDRMADARIFVGEQAVSAGLCDSIGTLDELVSSLAVPRFTFGSGNNGQRAADSGHRYARRIVQRKQC